MSCFHPQLKSGRSVLLAFILALVLLPAVVHAGRPIPSSSSWTTLAPGLEFARFPLPGAATPDDSLIAVLRIDPADWRFVLHSISQTGDSTGFPARKWAEKYGMTAVINAGMFDVDLSTHIGLMVTPKHANNPHTHPRHLSAVAFDPKRKGLPLFRIFDLDVTKMRTVEKRYGSVLQNLRLIKRPGENRWKKNGKAWWGEAALGEDRAGRALFIYVSSPITMHDLNDILLSLPLGIVAAQHLEGGFPAEMYIHAGSTRIEFHTGHEIRFDGNRPPSPGRSLPNVLGIVPRSSR